MANNYDVMALKAYLFEKQEIDPDQYDGSYELLRETIRAYSHINDYSDIDFNDLNLVYLMVIGTWKHGIERKKDIVNASHLSAADKTLLVELLDRLWNKAVNHGYVNHYDSEAGQIGMFGTGFYSFKNKTTKESSVEFIKMCVDILGMDDDNEMYDRAETVLNKDFHGMKAAASSVVLHCLKPGTFPILNTNMGADNIFEALGIKLRKKTEIDTYIKNCRAIKKFRDKNFSFKNYRVFDIAARELPKFAESSAVTAKIDVEKLKAEIEQYKSSKPEIYKWEAVKCFQDNFDIEAEDFVSMLKKSLEKSDNLLSRQNFLAKAGITHIAEYNPEYCRTMFRNLFDESEPVLNRIQQFEDDSEIYYEFKPDRSKKTYQDEKASTIYLFFRYPEKYYMYMSMKFEYAALQIGYDNIPKAGSPERIQAYFDLCDQIWNYAKTDKELVELCNGYLTDKCYKDADDAKEQNHILAEDLVFFINWSYKSAHNKTMEEEPEGFFPAFDDYNPGITAEQYETIFSNKELLDIYQLDVLYYTYKLGGEATCKQLENNYGNSYRHYNANAKHIAEVVQAHTDCSLYKNSEGQEAVWPVLFFGKNVSGIEGSFVWKLRKPVEEAIKSMNEKGLFNDMSSMVDYPKNMILYGPPGTGKTYHTIIYSVAIIEGKDVEKVQDEKIEDVKARYDDYVKKGQISATTFHQSYSYEEFIEGIKPIMSKENEDGGKDIKYKVEPGIFKRFCEKAGIPASSATGTTKDYGFNKEPAVWKVSLSGTGDNPIRTECMENGHIRIGWEQYGKEISEDTDYSQAGGKNVLNAFFNKMKKGDIVFSCYSQSEIDAIGVVTGDPDWNDDFDDLKRFRNVKWIAKGLKYNIVDINDGSVMTLGTIYRLYIPLSTVYKVLEEVLGGEKHETSNPNKVERFVFIIDEINRGNISKIFGELITLIEATKRIGKKEEMQLVLPYSVKPFGIPDNVYIIGTMNTADRSIALMDTALRRRFDFVEMQPDVDVLEDIAVKGINIPKMLETMNKRIEILCDREHTIGHAYFMKLKDDNSLECLSEIFQKNIIPLLQEYFYDDYEKIRLVLADNQKPQELQFVTKNNIDVTELFGNTDEDIDADNSYSINKDVFDSRPEAYIGIYSK